MEDEFIGTTLGRYELQSRLGRGGMAEVYRAYQPSLDRLVAIKILHPFLGEDPEFKARFEREARSVAQLRHQNIVHVYDFEFDADRDLYYMVMEYIDGPTLRTRLHELEENDERMPVAESARIIHRLAGAVAYAHSRGMAHRDIKPANVMLDSDNRIVLTDFGIARMVSGPNMTASGSLVGTPAYMSPEQGLGQIGDHRSDIYSLGVVFYQMLTGVMPYDADTPIAVVLKHVNDPLPPPRDINPDIPESLERILYRALEKAPEDRYQTADEFISDLEAVVNVENGAGGLAFGFAAPEQERAGCLVIALLLLLALAALLGGVYAGYNGLLADYFVTASSAILSIV